MGIYRFLLAFLVMLSHTPGSYIRTNYGAAAVLAFYFISGYLMALSFETFSKRSSQPIRSFFTDRFVKLWPSFLLVFFISIPIYLWIGVEVNFKRAFLELFILPSAYTKMLILGGLSTLPIVPPAWSLGVEVHFYLMVPLLALLSMRTKIIAAYALAALHLIALTRTEPLGAFIWCPGIIRDTLCSYQICDYFGFDLPYIVGVTFLLGNISYGMVVKRAPVAHHLLAIWAAYAVSFLVIFPYTLWIKNLSVYDVLFSFTLLLPAALALLAVTKDGSPPLVDRIFGSLSYPLFLVHFLARRIVEYGLGPYPANPHVLPETVVLAIVLAALVALFQERVVDWHRYRLRGFGPLAERTPTKEAGRLSPSVA